MQLSKAAIAVALFAMVPLAADAQSTSYTGTPYSGSAPRVPVVIPAVDFDKGGEGVGYHDLSPGNLGGLYRTSESVDIVPSTDSAFGPYQVQYFQNGEWLNYTVNVPVSGNYDLSIRASNNYGIGAFHIEVDGRDVTGTIPVPKTGSWTAYEWFGKQGVALGAGKHVVKIVTETQWFNVSALSIQASAGTGNGGGGSGGYTGTPHSGTPIAAPATFPAVNFDKGGEGIAYHDLSSTNLGGMYRTSEAVDIYGSTDSANGPYQVWSFQSGEWMSYTVNVPANGHYDLGIRAANNLAPGAFRIEVDGVNVTGTIAVPSTGSWSTYEWFGKKGVLLTAGKHVVKLVSEKQWFDVSAVTVLAGSSAPGGDNGDGDNGYAGTPYGATPIAAPATFPAVHFDKGGEGVAYHDLSSGNLGDVYRSDGVDIRASTDSAGGPYQVWNFQTGEWMSYTVNVPANGNYDLGIRAANNLAPGAFRIEVDGVNVTGTVAVPLTGSWSTYEWFGKNGVALTAGKHVVKLVSEKQWFDVSALSIQGSAGAEEPGDGNGTPPATVLWTAGMEAGNLNEWSDEVNSGSADSVAVTAATAGIPAKGGKWVMRQSVTGSSGATRMLRYPEIDSLTKSGKTFYVSWWDYFPTGVTFSIYDHFLLFHIVARNSAGAYIPMWTFGINPSGFTTNLVWSPNNMAPAEGPHAGESGKRFYTNPRPVPIGQWVFFEVMITPATDFTGAVKLSMNGEVLYDLSRVKTRFPVAANPGAMSVEHTAYGLNLRPTPYTHYMDDVTISLGSMR